MNGVPVPNYGEEYNRVDSFTFGYVNSSGDWNVLMTATPDRTDGGETSMLVMLWAGFVPSEEDDVLYQLRWQHKLPPEGGVSFAIFNPGALTYGYKLYGPDYPVNTAPAAACGALALLPTATIGALA